MQTFEEAIRDHLRLRNDKPLSDEQTAEVLGRRRPLEGAPTLASAPRGRGPRGGRHGLRRDGSNGGAATVESNGAATPAYSGGAAHRVASNGARARGEATPAASSGTLWLRDDELRGESASTKPRPRRATRAWRSATALRGLQLVIALLLAVVGDAALDVADGDRIASGVRVGGVPVGGLGARSAHERLERRLGAVAREPLQLQASGRLWSLSLSRGEVSVDASAAVRAALDRSHDGAFPRRVVRALPGGGLDVDLAPSVAFRRGTLDRFIDRVARALERAPLNATVRSAGAQLRPVPDRPGTAVPRGTLEALVRAHIASTVARRTLSVPRRVQHANVRVSDLRTKYRHYVLIRRDAFRLEYFRGMRLAGSYPIAVGMEGLDTPAGLYEIQGKQINPPWLVPNSPWAGDKAGKLIPPGPDNPIKARWLGFNGSAGIHGTSEVGSLGQRASHGCVRMSVPDVIDLSRRVPVHAPVRVE